MSDFIKSVLSNDNGVGSANRVGLLAVIVGLVLWSSNSVYLTGTLPQIPSTWIDVIMWLGGFTVAGKAGDVIKAVKAAGSVE